MKSSQSLLRLAVSSLCLCLSLSTPFAQDNTQQEGLTTFKTRKVVRDGKYDVAIIANFTYHEQYQELQKYVSKRLFKVEDTSLQVAYENYTNTLGDIIDDARISSSGQAEFYKVECLGGLKDYYQNYAISYSKDRLDESGKNMTTKTLSRNFIFDVRNNKVLTLNDVFVPQKAEELKALIGKSTPKMKMGERDITIEYKKGGKQEKMHFIYKSHKNDFADSFNQLVDAVEKNSQSNTLAKPAEGTDSLEQMPRFGEYTYQQFIPDPNTPKKGTYVMRTESGDKGLMAFLRNNIKYPEVAEENGIQGRVVTTFVIEADGSITDVNVLKSVDPSLDKEALRVVKSMPKWISGMQNGKPARAKFTLPITFGLK